MEQQKVRPECDLCGEPIDIRILQPCNHNNICLHCFIRFNRNYKGNHCYFCQNPIEKGSEPVATTNLHINYETARKRNPPFDPEFNIYVLNREAVNEALKKLYQFECPDCGMVLPTIDAFSCHMKTHKKNVCNICYASGRFTPESVPIFPQNKYAEHLHQHPKCICCHQTFFDQNTLAHHMNEEHHRCELCAKNNRIVWFKDAADLVKHNEKKHFVCHHPECSSESLIAFATRGELLFHLQRVHGERVRQVDFTTDFDNGIEEEDQDDSRERMIQLNKKLMTRLNDSFRNDPQSIQALRGYALKLIRNVISCDEFYKQFSKICGDKKDLIFCDMVASMPDPRKRAELFRIHNGIGSIMHPSIPKSKSTPQMSKISKQSIKIEKPNASGAVRINSHPQQPAQPSNEAEIPSRYQGVNKKKDKRRKKVVLSAF